MSEDSEDKVAGDVEFIRTLLHVDWGFMIGDCFIEVPKLPLVRAGYRFPPFDVTMPSGSVRRIIEVVKGTEVISDGNSG